MHVFPSNSCDLDFQTGVTMKMLFCVFSTLKRVVLCKRCRSVSQREPGLSLEEFASDANSFWCYVDILVEVRNILSTLIFK